MQNKVLKELVIKGKKIQIVKGDITEEESDAIVNPANNYLRHSGGVAGAIVRKGGKIIQEESDKIGYVPTGNAVYTSAGSLKAKYVIHSVGPRWGEGDEENKLRSAVRNSLKLATELKLKSISIPAISTGIFGYPKREGTWVILDEVRSFLENEESTIEVVRLTNIDDETCNLFLEHIEKLGG
ncbi:MAG: macro domain-containing protein [Thermosulfidibacteraceae bacterium]|jgi:O-acetyl-ADP-ribose deacetylase (regulator of RNase III)